MAARLQNYFELVIKFFICFDFFVFYLLPIAKCSTDTENKFPIYHIYRIQYTTYMVLPQFNVKDNFAGQ